MAMSNGGRGSIIEAHVPTHFYKVFVNIPMSTTWLCNGIGIKNGVVINRVLVEGNIHFLAIIVFRRSIKISAAPIIIFLWWLVFFCIEKVSPGFSTENPIR